MFRLPFEKDGGLNFAEDTNTIIETHISLSLITCRYLNLINNKQDHFIANTQFTICYNITPLKMYAICIEFCIKVDHFVRFKEL